MTRYFCPYCLPSQQTYKMRDDGVMICGECGDPLVEFNRVDFKRIFSLIVVGVFLAPLIVLVFAFIQDHKRYLPRPPHESLVNLDKLSIHDLVDI